MPGAVAGLNHALSAFGTKGLPEVMDPAIRMADLAAYEVCKFDPMVAEHRGHTLYT